MRVINISLSELETKMLLIGFEGENQITQVRIDAAEILTDYPNATPTLIVKPLFGFAYPVIVAQEGTDVVWEIDNSVLSSHGDGEIQLTFTEGSVIAKSYVGRIRIKRSLAVNGEKPDPIETWEQAATAKLAEVDAQIGELEDMVEAAEAAKDEAQGIVDDAAADIQAAGAAQVQVVQAAGEEVLDSIPSDYTELSDDVTGLKSAFETYEGGTTGQVLRKRSNADNDVEWASVGQPTDEQTAEAVNNWLDDHPEATTTVQDGSITEVKLASDLKGILNPEYKSPYKYDFSDIGDKSKIITVKKDSDFSSAPRICFGKNYFPKANYFTGNTINNVGMAISAEDGYKIRIVGTATSAGQYWIKEKSDDSRFYPIPDDIHVGDVLNMYLFGKTSTNRGPTVAFYIYDSNKTQLVRKAQNIDANSSYAQGLNTTVPEGATYISFAIEWVSGRVHDNIVFPVIVKNTTTINSSLTFVDGYATLNTDNPSSNVFVGPHKAIIQTDFALKKYIDINDVYEPNISNVIKPEDFGAWGDGAHNDIYCLQNCVDYAIANGKTIIGGGHYCISEPLRIIGDYLSIKLRYVEYLGTDSAIKFTGKFGNIDIGAIKSTNGVCFKLWSTAESSYNRIRIGYGWAGHNCIELTTNASHIICNSIIFDYLHSGSNYNVIEYTLDDEYSYDTSFTNNNNFTGGRLSGGRYGVYNAKSQDTYMTCMFEDVDNCIYATAAQNIRVIAPRWGEVHQHWDEPGKGLIIGFPSFEYFRYGSGYGYGFSIDAPSLYTSVMSFDVSGIPGVRKDSNDELIPIPKDSPPPNPVYVPLQTRANQIVASWFFTFANHILIKEPYRKIRTTVKATDSGYSGDYRITGSDMEFKIYERYIIDDPACDYTLPPSYDNIAFNHFFVEQSNGNYCTFRDWRGTACFDGQTYGDGTYEVDITVQNNSDNYYNQYQVWEIRRVGTGELIDTMPHSQS